MKTIRRMCPSCDHPRPFDKEQPNHILHLLLTILTVGLWGIVWIAMAIDAHYRPFICRTCGMEVMK